MPNPTAGNCFHPIDDLATRNGATPCFDPAAVAPVAMCVHPADEPTAAAPVAICFHPADEPAARVPVDMCFHPGDRRADLGLRPADDLAIDLHRALTGADERDLAALAPRP